MLHLPKALALRRVIRPLDHRLPRLAGLLQLLRRSLLVDLHPLNHPNLPVEVLLPLLVMPLVYLLVSLLVEAITPVVRHLTFRRRAPTPAPLLLRRLPKVLLHPLVQVLRQDLLDRLVITPVNYLVVTRVYTLLSRLVITLVDTLLNRLVITPVEILLHTLPKVLLQTLVKVHRHIRLLNPLLSHLLLQPDARALSQF